MSREKDITGQGGARPGAGRPKGAKDKEPRAPLGRKVQTWARVHPHTLERLEADASLREVPPAAIVEQLIERRYKCRCAECQEARREIRRRERAVAR